jgi:hypothetical protein
MMTSADLDDPLSGWREPGKSTFADRDIPERPATPGVAAMEDAIKELTRANDNYKTLVESLRETIYNQQQIINQVIVVNNHVVGIKND